MLRPIPIAASLMSMAAPAQAVQILTFTDANAFTGALTTPSLLEDFADAALQPGLAISGARLNYTAGALRQSLNPASAPSLTFSFAGGIGAFGGDFDLTPGGVGQGFDVAVSFVDSTLADRVIGRTINASGFIGFTSSDAVRAVRFLPRAGGDETYTFDNLRFAEAAPAAVPEPSTWLTMACGIGLAGTALRRGRRRLVRATA